MTLLNSFEAHFDVFDPAVETVPSEPQMCWYQISKGANWGRYQLPFLFKRQNPSIACVVGTYRGLLAEFGTFLALLMLMLVPIQTLHYLCCLLIGLLGVEIVCF